jgi:biotin carboxyl carrier protein
MPYIATIKDHVYRIDPGENIPQRIITLNDAPYKIDWSQLAPLATKTPTMGGHFSLLIAGKSYNIFARRLTKPDEGDSQTYEVLIAGQRFEVQVEDEREKKLASKGERETGDAQVRAPMPGLVIGILLEVGTSVEHGQIVVVLEAMKMENDLVAPRSGIVKEIHVSKGQAVNQGDVLVIIGKE